MPDWRMTILSIAVIVFLAYLGQWQLHRAAEKKQMLTVEAQFQQLPALKWQSPMELPRQYQRIEISGEFQPQLFFFDNQHYQHQFGYDVLSPLKLNDGQIILVDRGWVKADAGQRQLPKINPVDFFQKIKGQVYYPSDKNWVLGQPLEKKAADIAIVERLDTKLISLFLHKSVYPFIIRLERGEPNGFTRDWAIVSMPPQRHYAYAVQWFAMAFVVLVIFIGLNLKKIDENI